MAQSIWLRGRFGVVSLGFVGALAGASSAATTGLADGHHMVSGEFFTPGLVETLEVSEHPRGTLSVVRAGEMIRSSGRVIWYSYATSAWVRGN